MDADEHQDGSEKRKVMDFDDLQEKLGGISRYQMGVIALVSVLSFGVSLMTQTSVFFSAEPEHRCIIPPFESDPPRYDDDNVTQKFIPPGESCKRYAYNLTECEIDIEACLSQNETSVVECDYDFVYSDEYYTETTVTEFDLVCGRSTLDALANSMYFVGVFLGSALIGPMMDWFGRKESMLIMCILTIVTSLLVAFSSSYEMYISMRVLQAMGSIPCYIAYFTYVLEIGTQKWKTYISAYANTTSTLSNSVLPIMAYFIRNWRNLCICLALMSTPYFVIYFFIPKSPRWLLTKKRNGEAKKVVEKFAKSRNEKLLDDDWNLTVETENDKLNMAAKQTRYTVLDLFKPSLMRMVSMNICYLWFVVSMIFYGLTLNVDTLVGDPYVNALLNGSVEIIGYLLLLTAPVIGLRTLGALSYFFSGVCCLTTMLLTQFADGDQGMLEASRWVAILGKLFATLSFGFIYQFTIELFPTVARGTAMSMGSMTARIGSIIMPFTLELQKTIPWLTQTIFGTLGVIGGATCLLLPETLKIGLLSSIDDAENFYRQNMKLTASIMGKRDEIYQSERVESKKNIAGYEFDLLEEKLQRVETKL